MKNWMLLAVAISFNSVANILIKAGMSKVVMPDGGLWEKVRYLAWTPKVTVPLVGGMLCFALNLAAYSAALTKVNLSVAYPIMTASCFVAIGLFSWLGFGERISALQLVGFALIIGGVWLVSMGPTSAAASG